MVLFNFLREERCTCMVLSLHFHNYNKASTMQGFFSPCKPEKVFSAGHPCKKKKLNGNAKTFFAIRSIRRVAFKYIETQCMSLQVQVVARDILSYDTTQKKRAQYSSSPSSSSSSSHSHHHHHHLWSTRLFQL